MAASWLLVVYVLMCDTTAIHALIHGNAKIVIAGAVISELEKLNIAVIYCIFFSGPHVEYQFGVEYFNK